MQFEKAIKHKMKKLLVIKLLLIGFLSNAQDYSNWGFEAKFKPGFLVGHRVVMGHLVKDHSYAVELSYVFRTNGEKAWHKFYNYPEISANLYYGSVGNTEILGNFVGAYSAITFPFVNNARFRFSGKLGSGLGFTNKRYDEISNNKNVAISTPINALINLGLEAKTYFGNNWITVGMDITHFSNGGFRVPNLGLNLPYLSFGYGRYISKTNEFSTKNVQSTIPQRTILFGATAISSIKEVFPTNGKAYPVYALSLNARVFVKPKMGWEAAFDVISKQALFGYRPEVEKTQLKVLQLGVYGGYLLPLNQFHFVLGMGVYVKDYYKPDGPLYHRVGMRYYFKNGLNLNCVLKAHWGKADYVEWGIGYSFFQRNKK